MSLELAAGLSEAATTIQRDLKLNLEKLTQSSSLDKVEAHLIVLAISHALNHERLQTYATEVLRGEGLTEDEIVEARESANIMAMNNIYYRTRHMIKEMRGDEVEKQLGMAGLRMNVLARPVLGKVRFELLAFAVSVLNGCAMCISSHQVSLEKHSVSGEKIHDTIRLTAVLKAVATGF